jgi:hypothetical protein
LLEKRDNWRNNGRELYRVFSGCFEGKTRTVKARMDEVNMWDFKEESRGEKIKKGAADERREAEQE